MGGCGAASKFFKLGSDTILARPGLAYFHPLDDPMSRAGYRVVQLDVPIVF